MHLILIGVNHTTAPVELREKLSISKGQLPGALACLAALAGVDECAVLSTCNRTEVYAYTQSKTQDRPLLSQLAQFCGIEPGDLRPSLYSRAGHKAAEHLFRVATGVDSMVLGETQILGQIKDAYGAASEAGCTGTVLNTMFQQAAAVGKRAQTETNISKGAYSVGSAAVRLARSVFADLATSRVLIVGAGKMADLTMNHLKCLGVSKVIVANRTYESARELAAQLGGRAVPFEELPCALTEADIVISSTGASEPIITRKMADSVMLARRGRPVFIIDIAVPRDVEQDVGEIDNVFLYNIDDLQAVIVSDSASRRGEVEKVEAVVAEETQRFARWFNALDAVPVIASLREKLETIRQAELEKLRRKAPHLSEADLAAVDAATRSIVNRICHQPMIRIKEYANDAEAATKLETICEAFGICPAEGAGEEKDDE